MRMSNRELRAAVSAAGFVLVEVSDGLDARASLAVSHAYRTEDLLGLRRRYLGSAVGGARRADRDRAR